MITIPMRLKGNPEIINSQLIDNIHLILSDNISLRAYVFVLYGPHEGGKSKIILNLYKNYKTISERENMNLSYLENRKPNQNKIKIFRNILERVKNTTEMIFIDNNECMLNDDKSINNFFLTAIHKSRSIIRNGHPLIIVISYPKSDLGQKLLKKLYQKEKIIGSLCIYEIESSESKK